MLRNVTSQTKAILFLLLVFLTWWLSPQFVKRWSGKIFAEFQAPALTSVSYLRDIQSYWMMRSHTRAELIESGIALSRRNAAYALRNQQVDFLEEEILAWESFFGMPSLPDYRYEVARVVHRDLNAWWQTLTIRKGRSSGLRAGQAVIFSGGVVGRVYSVNTYTAVVELVSSPRFRSAAHFEGDLRPVEYSGRLNHGLTPASGSVSTVPADIQTSHAAPLRLTSSRLGGVFPDGLTIGWVHHLEPTPDGLFQRGIVRLDARLLELREVAVLVPLLEETSEP